MPSCKKYECYSDSSSSSSSSSSDDCCFPGPWGPWGPWGFWGQGVGQGAGIGLNAPGVGLNLNGYQGQFLPGLTNFGPGINPACFNPFLQQIYQQYQQQCQQFGMTGPIEQNPMPTPTPVYPWFGGAGFGWPFDFFGWGCGNCRECHRGRRCRRKHWCSSSSSSSSSSCSSSSSSSSSSESSELMCRLKKDGCKRKLICNKDWSWKNNGEKKCEQCNKKVI
jgi:hypothetical protein